MDCDFDTRIDELEEELNGLFSEAEICMLCKDYKGCEIYTNQAHDLIKLLDALRAGEEP